MDAPIGSFPVPHGAHALSGMACDKQALAGLSPVTPSTASSFYMSQLPQAGYQVTSNTGGTGPGASGLAIEITSPAMGTRA